MNVSGNSSRIPTLLLPGTLCDATLWQDLDLLDTLCGELLEPNLELLAQTLLDSAPARFALLGFSLGAIVAFEILRQAPERVLALTLVSANPHPPSATQLSAWREQQRLALSGQLEQVARGYAAQDSAAVKAKVLEMARQMSGAFPAQLELLRFRPDSRDVLKSWSRLGRPTALVGGQSDLLTPPRLARELHALIPHSTLDLLRGGHYVPLEWGKALAHIVRLNHTLVQNPVSALQGTHYA